MIDWAAKNGCVGLTADESIRHLSIEREAIVACGPQVFCFPWNNLVVAEQIRRVVTHARAMERLVSERPGPWLAGLSEDRPALKWEPRR